MDKPPPGNGLLLMSVQKVFDFASNLLERATRIELVTSSLGSWHSTAELRPLGL
jgi:hypothetical protein